jgi:hypothetical protein
VSEHVPHAKIKKPKGGKVSPVSATAKDVPVKIGRADIPSDMGRTRSGIHHSPEIWGNRTFSAGDRKHPHAKPD